MEHTVELANLHHVRSSGLIRAGLRPWTVVNDVFDVVLLAVGPAWSGCLVESAAGDLRHPAGPALAYDATQRQPTVDGKPRKAKLVLRVLSRLAPALAYTLTARFADWGRTCRFGW